MDDQKEMQVTTKDMLKFVFNKVLKQKWILVVNILALTLITALQFVMPQFEKIIIDKIIPMKDLHWLALVIGGLLLTAVVLGLLNYFSSYYMGVMSQSAITELRNDLYHDLLRQDTAFFESSKTGDLMVRLTSDINNLQSMISSNMLSMIGNLFTFVGVLVFIYIVNWQMALAVTVTFPLMFVIYRVFRDRIHKAYRAARLSQSKMSNQMQNTLTQIDLIKSYTNEELAQESFNEASDQNRRDMIKATQNGAIFSPLIDGVNYLQVAIILSLGAYFVMKGQLTVGALVAYLTYVAMLQSPIMAFTRLLNQIQQSLVSYGRINEITQVKPTILEPDHPVAFPKSPLAVELDHVNFSYLGNSEMPTIEDVSFDVPAGKTTALVGHSGSGKSTITKLIDRMYDINGGQITINGDNIAYFRLEDLRRHIAIVSQDLFILDGTLRDNVVYAKQDATDEEVERVIEMADLTNFVAGLPDGLATQVGERGVKLSGGQKQRLSIARALLKNAPIVILDEATASLDNEAEKQIQHALDNLTETRTTIVIAHRLSTVYGADQIVVIDDGKVVEKGTHQSLLDQNGAYAKLYQAQFN
ncbi:ABC transporter ATP-binding protein MsbA family protein [Lentilactobacillus senioris DSM 24302 = JCM 17472]|uniref:ABC transporter ATP-binding protein MsbA family protein n=1 Tax=Lentilactobacillus senioris DSM 24302 = JCM 17472 TaxID=1423802 RepID=A0A0R2CSY8_9LACO|nr:ABC transporter ATP-binding protein [Lentilactobacillus senioris]KRM94400.1 ABC transporter ATP-binding protein MsbA family protein [Lentilactobacillus senioris DSM 24302 = JCM 17472]